MLWIVVVYSLQSLQQLLLLEIYSERSNFLILYLNLAKLRKSLVDLCLA